MSEPELANEDSVTLADTAAIQRPHVWTESITFSDGTTLAIGRDEIVVFVGPNNAGKSAALREAHRALSIGASARGPVLTAVKFGYEGTPQDLEDWLLATAPRNADGHLRLSMVGMVGPGTGNSIWSKKENRGLQSLTNLMTVHLDTEARLTAANPVDLVNFVTEVPTHALHRLYDDEDLEKALDAVVTRAFRQNLVVNRGAGRQVMLHIGQRPTPPPGKDRQSHEFRSAVNALPPVNTQGDGIRAFVGIVASVMAADRDIVFIDEPEAFLHPPQAATLGRVLSEQTPSGRQLLVSTHSSDILRGILDHSSPRVRVVRLTRQDKINRVTELRPEVVRQVWSDPLLRYSRVLEGLFHDGVIVCEGDADCRFYGAMMDAVSKDAPTPDLLLVYGAGKSRIATIVGALRAIGVPVRVVTDFDVLADEHDLATIFSALGGKWAEIEADWRAVRAAIDQRRAEVPAEEARKEILAILNQERGHALSSFTITKVRGVLKKGSAWAEAKRLGKAFVPSGQQSATYERLAKHLRAVGMHIVEVGELEGFCRTVDGHGPGWVTDVLQRDLENDPELAGARDFARALSGRWEGVGPAPDAINPPDAEGASMG